MNENNKNTFLPSLESKTMEITSGEFYTQICQTFKLNNNNKLAL